MSRFLVLAGIALVILGLAWPWLQRLGLGRLPGDFVIERGGVRIHLPLATCLLISLVLTLVSWLLRR